jgi:hypothetical protein
MRPAPLFASFIAAAAVRARADDVPESDTAAD